MSATAARTEVTAELALDMYRRMAQIRLFEENANDLYRSAKMPGLTHLYIGEEAVAVGGLKDQELPHSTVLLVAQLMVGPEGLKLKMTFPFASRNESVGLARGLATPKLPSDGPSARTRTRCGGSRATGDAEAARSRSTRRTTSCSC